MWYLAAGLIALLYFSGTGEQALNLIGFELDIYNSQKKWADKFGVPFRVVRAIGWNESRNGLNSRVRRGIENPQDVIGSASYDGLSWGVMQTKPSTARDMIRISDNAALKQWERTATDKDIAVWLNTPDNSIYVGVKYLAWCKAWLLKNTPITEASPNFEEHWIKSYNAGIGTAKKIILSRIEAAAKGTPSLAYSQVANSYYQNFISFTGV